ncbi:hypothetical protein K402DRAFT_150030 [Aulographum hederae CBS 113979]|uniref:Uncharacterized protein n=1 Tax=Aulographum hederae CBS 113979 TaxID=1176131 RepID=A0A6G1GTL9_9PEZI|nr:hypothetical protein K402DRAFT_150030 [Aulographum hederae CBS 113979]
MSVVCEAPSVSRSSSPYQWSAMTVPTRMFSSWGRNDARKYASDNMRVGGLVSIDSLERENATPTKRSSNRTSLSASFRRAPLRLTVPSNKNIVDEPPTPGHNLQDTPTTLASTLNSATSTEAYQSSPSTATQYTSSPSSINKPLPRPPKLKTKSIKTPSIAELPGSFPPSSSLEHPSSFLEPNTTNLEPESNGEVGDSIQRPRTGPGTKRGALKPHKRNKSETSISGHFGERHPLAPPPLFCQKRRASEQVGAIMGNSITRKRSASLGSTAPYRMNSRKEQGLAHMQYNDAIAFPQPPTLHTQALTNEHQYFKSTTPVDSLNPDEEVFQSSPMDEDTPKAGDCMSPSQGDYPPPIVSKPRNTPRTTSSTNLHALQSALELQMRAATQMAAENDSMREELVMARQREADMAVMKRERDELKRMLEENQSQIETCMNHLSKAQVNEKALRNKVKSLEARLEDSNTQRLDALEINHEIQQKMKRMSKRQRSMSRELEQVHSQAGYSDLDRLRLELQESRQRAVRLEDQLAVTRSIKEVPDLVTRLTKQVEELQENVNDKNDFIRDLEMANGVLRLDKAQAEEKYEALVKLNEDSSVVDQAYVKHTEDCKHMSTRICELEAQIEEKETSLRFTKGERDQVALLLHSELRRQAALSQDHPQAAPLGARNDTEKIIADLQSRAHAAVMANESGETLYSDAATTPAKRIELLEREIAYHLNDIVLYKLDVKGYKKDLRQAKAKLQRLQTGQTQETDHHRHHTQGQGNTLTAPPSSANSPVPSLARTATQSSVYSNATNASTSTNNILGSSLNYNYSSHPTTMTTASTHQAPLSAPFDNINHMRDALRSRTTSSATTGTARSASNASLRYGSKRTMTPPPTMTTQHQAASFQHFVATTPPAPGTPVSAKAGGDYVYGRPSTSAGGEGFGMGVGMGQARPRTQRSFSFSGQGQGQQRERKGAQVWVSAREVLEG